MKKFIFGITLMFIGFIGFAMLCCATMSSTYTLNGSNKYSELWRLYGLSPIVALFLILAIIGLIISVICIIKDC